MSTENDIKESVSKVEKAFSTKKLSFLAGMQKLSGVPTLLLWGEDQAPGTIEHADPFVHFVRCQRFGYPVYLPVMDKGCAA